MPHCGRASIRRPPSVDDGPERPSKDDREPAVELRPEVLGEVVALPLPRDRMREAADPHRELEGLELAAAPRLEVGIAEPREPRARRRQPVAFLEEPERLDERGER